MRIKISDPKPEMGNSSRLMLLGILSAVFAVNIIDVFVPLLLPEIASTYNITRSVAATLTAYSSLAGVVTGFALSALSIKVRYKILLVLAVITTPICILGVYLAPSFLMAQLFYAFNGVGSVIVASMTPALIADVYPLSKKAIRITWGLSTAYIALLVANPITGFLATSGTVSSWRDALLWFLLPATMVCLVLVILLVPSKTSLTQYGSKKPPFLNGYREIMSNRSAVACLTNNFLGSIWLAAQVFVPVSYADIFGLTPASRGIIGMVIISVLVAGLLIGGFLVNPIGRKRLMITGAFTAIIVIVTSYVITIFIPNLYLTVVIRAIGSFIGGFVFAASPNLSVEQVPRYRGTMMSLGQGLSGIGQAVGVFVGGAVLAFVGTTAAGYAMTIGTLGMLGLTGTFTLTLFAKDPCLNQPKNL